MLRSSDLSVLSGVRGRRTIVTRTNGRIAFAEALFKEGHNLSWRDPKLGAPRISFKTATGTDAIRPTARVSVRAS